MAMTRCEEIREYFYLAKDIFGDPTIKPLMVCVEGAIGCALVLDMIRRTSEMIKEK